MVRMPLIAGNWKMNTTVAEAVGLARDLKVMLEPVAAVEKVLCPPFVSLAAVKAAIAGSSIRLGAQNMYFREKGAYTGEVSPLMLSGLCEYVILGHSERRAYFAETDELVNAKVKTALLFKLAPIVCVGERLEENERGQTEEVVVRQVRGALAGLGKVDSIVIAYEPVWAIGTGKAATPAQAADVIHLIRRTVASALGADAGLASRILYGGSVTGDNVADFLADPDIDGALVGGASLKAGEFASIVSRCAAAKAGARH